MNARDLKTGDKIRITKTNGRNTNLSIGDEITIERRNNYVYYDGGALNLSNSYFDKFYDFELVEDETPISLLMKQLGVVDDEEFDIIDSEGNRIVCSPYKFKNGKLYDCDGDLSTRLLQLIYSNNTIKKLPQKSEEELKLEEIQKTIDELQKQKNELEASIKGK